MDSDPPVSDEKKAIFYTTHSPSPSHPPSPSPSALRRLFTSALAAERPDRQGDLQVDFKHELKFAESPGENQHSATTTFLSLPWLLKWHIYTHLRSKDSIALSSTCSQMYDLNMFSYTHLQFLPPNSLFFLARSVHRLAEVLACSPHYALAVRTLRIVGWNVTNVREGYDIGMVYKALDEGVSIILQNAPQIHSLTLDFSLTKTIHRFSQTSATLARVRTIRNLRLAMFLVPMAENDSLQERTPDQAPPAYERVSLRVGSGARMPAIMQDPRNLRWFKFMVVGTWSPGDKGWDMTLQRVAEAATELETLVLGAEQDFEANTLGQLLQSGFVRVSEVVSPLW